MNVRTTNSRFDLTSFVMDYEAGELGDDDIIEGFQHMIDNGSVWQLQGHYGRTAHSLIASGLCTPARS
jgi:hypothetical protein